MPLSLLKYNAASVKSRAMYSRLMSPDDYETIITKKTVKDAVQYLKSVTSYGDILDEIDENDVHRGDVEILLRRSLYNDYLRLGKFIQGGTSPVFDAFFHKYEADELKLLFRELFTGRDNESIDESFIFLKDFSKLDFDYISKAAEPDELIRMLRSTDYSKALSFFEGRKDISLFDIEMSIDINYYLSLLKTCKNHLSGNDYKQVSGLLGTEIDIMNIRFIYRSKRLFDLSKEETLNNVVPHWFKLKRHSLVGFSESNNMEEFKKTLSKTRYARFFDINNEALWEKDSRNFLIDYYKKMMKKNSLSLTSLIAYLRLKETDIQSLVSVIEGIRYNLPSQEIKKLYD